MSGDAPVGRRPGQLLALVLALGLIASAAAGALASSVAAEARAQRLEVVTGRVVADVTASIDGAVAVATATGVAASASTGGDDVILPDQVLLDRAVDRLTRGRDLEARATGLVAVLVVAAPAGLVAASPASARDPLAFIEAAGPLDRVLDDTAGTGVVSLGHRLDAPIAGGDLPLVLPLYRTARALQPTATVQLRREEIIGWVVTVLDATRIGERAGLAAGAPVSVTISDTADDTVLVSGAAGDGPARDVLLGVPGGTWRVTVAATGPLLTATDRSLPWLVAMATALLTAAAGALVWLLATQRRRALAAVERATEDLALANAELRRSNADLSEFAGVVAHDLKSPLTVLMGVPRMLRARLADSSDPQLPGLLEMMDSSGRTMMDLIDDLLSYAAVGAANVEVEDIDLHALVSDVLETLPAYVESPDRVTVEPLPVVRGDRRMLAQALANLLGNALKFVADGVEPRVVVSASTDGDHVSVDVADNGVGIPADEREVVLKAFNRSSRTDAVEGTGLGLAIVGKVAYAHGGDVRLADSPLGGTTVSLRVAVEGGQQ